MAKRKYTPSWGRIANKLTKMLKEKIQYYDLIDTGLMLDSIWCDYDGETLVIHAEEYFKYLDEGTENIPAYNIVKDCINSKEFQDYIKFVLVEEIEYELKDIK
jgi:hypothetical protein